MSFGCSDDDFEAPYFSRSHLPYPDIGLRVSLACAQMLAYHERFPASSKMLMLFYEAFNQHASQFDKAYE